jgi:hypothetical protein
LEVDLGIIMRGQLARWNRGRASRGGHGREYSVMPQSG